MPGVSVERMGEITQQGLVVVSKIIPAPSLTLQSLALQVFSGNLLQVLKDDSVAPKQHPVGKDV